MKIYSDATVTKQDLDHLSTKHSDEFYKFKMTLMALVAANIITLGLVLFLYLR